MRRKPPFSGRRSGSVYAEPDPLNFGFSPEFFFDPCVKPCHRAALGGKLVDVLHQGGAFACVGKLRNPCLAKGVNKIRNLSVPKQIRKFKYLQLVLDAARPCSVGFVCTVKGKGMSLFSASQLLYSSLQYPQVFSSSLRFSSLAFLLSSQACPVLFISSKNAFSLFMVLTSVFYFRVCLSRLPARSVLLPSAEVSTGHPRPLSGEVDSRHNVTRRRRGLQSGIRNC